MEPLQHAFERFAMILEEVPAVGDLERVWSADVRPARIFERSRAITSTPGCSVSQAAKVSAVRSGKRSIEQCCARSTRILP